MNYTITVTNKGNVTIKDIVVTDDLTGATWTIASLEPGKTSEPLTTSYAVLPKDAASEDQKIVNTVKAVGTSADGKEVKDDDFVEVATRKIPLTITAGSDKKVYDGKNLTNDSHKLEGDLVTGNKLASVTIAGSQLNVGTGANKASEAKIVDKDNKDVTEAYEITYVEGKLEVTKATLTITVIDQTYTYDGEVHGEQNSVYTVWSEILGKVKVEGLMENDTITSITLNGSRKDVGTEDIVIMALTMGRLSGSGVASTVMMVSRAMNVAANEDNVSGNYTITLNKGTLTIVKATDNDVNPEPADNAETMDADSKSIKVMYDGVSHTVSAKATKEGSKIEYSTDGGKTWTEEAPKQLNVGKVTFSIRATNDNYEPVVKDGYTLEVTKRKVVMTSGDAKKEYDGKALTAETVTESGDGFVEGEGAEYSFTGKQTEVGSSENTFTYTLKDGTLADNYEIEQVFGTLTVDQQPKMGDEGDLTLYIILFSSSVLAIGGSLIAAKHRRKKEEEDAAED